MKILSESTHSLTFTGLRYLIIFHKFCGISYFWASIANNDRIIGKLLRILSIVWNLVFFGFTLKLMYENLSDHKFYTMDFNSSKSIITAILIIVGINGYYVQVFAINILLMISGNQIIDSIKSHTFRYIDEKIEIRNGLIIAFTQFGLVFTLELIFFLVLKLIIRVDITLINHLMYFFQYFLFLVNISSVSALIAYQSRIICLQMDKISENLTPRCLPEIYQFICKVNTFDKNFDSLVSSKLLMIIFTSSIISISCLCVISIRKFFYQILSLTENILLLLSLCYICDIIPKKVKVFCDQIEDLMSEYVSNDSSINDLNKHLILIKMNSVKQELGFTAMGLFKINTNTILSVFTLVISYSVILIQTSSQC